MVGLAQCNSLTFMPHPPLSLILCGRALHAPPCIVLSLSLMSCITLVDGWEVESRVGYSGVLRSWEDMSVTY
jgi:hypothetical protein